MVVSFSSLDGVTIQGKKYYLQKGGIRYSGWQTFKQKKRYYLSNGVLASNDG